MNFKNLLSLRRALQDSRLYTEAMNVNYLIKCAAVDPIATNKTTESDVPEGFFSPEDIAPENYMKKLWQLYYKDIRTFNFDNFVKSFMREGKSEAEAKELAEQTQKVILALGDYMKIQALCCIGGKSVEDDLRMLNHGVHIISGTPGKF